MGGDGVKKPKTSKRDYHDYPRLSAITRDEWDLAHRKGQTFPPTGLKIGFPGVTS